MLLFWLLGCIGVGWIGDLLLWTILISISVSIVLKKKLTVDSRLWVMNNMTTKFWSFLFFFCIGKSKLITLFVTINYFFFKSLNLLYLNLLDSYCFLNTDSLSNIIEKFTSQWIQSWPDFWYRYLIANFKKKKDNVLSWY